MSTLPLSPQTPGAAVILQLAIRLPQLGYGFNQCQSRFSNACVEKCLKRQVQGENEGIKVISLGLTGGGLNTQSCFHNPTLLYHLYACEEAKKTRKSQIPLQMRCEAHHLCQAPTGRCSGAKPKYLPSVMTSHTDVQNQGTGFCFIKQSVLPSLITLAPDCIDSDNT